MALPDNIASSPAVIADYIHPYNQFTGPLEDFEMGGIALNDSSEGVDYQTWYLWYNDDEESPGYGDFTVRAETTGVETVIINVPNVTRCGLAFNQNMDPFIAYETRACEAKYYWWDPTLPGFTTTTLPGNSHWVACCLDDHRITQNSTSDIILGYVRAGTLYYRQLRDRFLTERSLGAVGAATLRKVGMTENLRLLFDVREGLGNRLSEIVGELCHRVGCTGNLIDVSALYDIRVRGYKSAGQYAAGDAIRTLQSVYFFDFPEIDGKLVAILRGGPAVSQISRAQCVSGDDFKFETAREQGFEFPRKMHMQFANAESDYTPTKVTVERRDPQVKAQSEMSIDTAVNFTSTEAAERINIIQKVAWSEFEGTATFSIPESHAALIPSDPISFEIRPGLYKRVRIDRMTYVDGVFSAEAVIDRGRAYISGPVVPPVITPGEPPPPTITGDTTWEFMDLPVLLTSFDALGLHAYIAARGDAGTAWRGAQLQREVAPEFVKVVDVPTAETMGVLAAQLNTAPVEFPDVTNTVLVTLNAAVASITDDHFLKGGNAMLIGNEIIQFRTAVAEGLNWRLSYLARGRLNTTPSNWVIGTRAVLLTGPTIASLDVALLDTTMTLRAVSFGQPGPDATAGPYTFTGRSQTEWAPKWFTATPDGADWLLAWMPRWRLGSATTPIKSIHFLTWRIKITDGGTTVIKDMLNPSYLYTSAEQTTDFGAPLAGFDIEIMGVNTLTGEGDILAETV